MCSPPPHHTMISSRRGPAIASSVLHLTTTSSQAGRQDWNIPWANLLPVTFEGRGWRPIHQPDHSAIRSLCVMRIHAQLVATLRHEQSTPDLWLLARSVFVPLRNASVLPKPDALHVAVFRKPRGENPTPSCAVTLTPSCKPDAAFQT